MKTLPLVILTVLFSSFAYANDEAKCSTKSIYSEINIKRESKSTDANFEVIATGKGVEEKRITAPSSPIWEVGASLDTPVASGYVIHLDGNVSFSRKNTIVIMFVDGGSEGTAVIRSAELTGTDFEVAATCVR